MANTHIESWDDVTASADNLAVLFGLKRETVVRFAKIEGMPKQGRGKYPVVECTRWFIERATAKNETPEDKKARIAVAKQQELRYKIENAQNLNELLPADLVQNAINQMASLLANQLDGLGPRMAAELADIDDPAVIQRKLFDECRGIRNAAAAALEIVAGDIDSSADTETAAKPKRGAVGRRKQGATTRKPRTRKVANG